MGREFPKAPNIWHPCLSSRVGQRIKPLKKQLKYLTVFPLYPKALGNKMGFEVDFLSFNENKVEGFKGQHGYNKTDFPSETISYLTKHY